tara:strand:- start:508 stop:735 length:228 start_codon:yes stop_codon:yes gene_type:complete
MDIERTIRQLKNDKKRIEKNIDLNKKRFIQEIKSGLGEEIRKGIVKEKTKKIKEEPQTKGLFRNMKKWILSLLKK